MHKNPLFGLAAPLQDAVGGKAKHWILAQPSSICTLRTDRDPGFVWGFCPFARLLPPPCASAVRMHMHKALENTPIRSHLDSRSCNRQVWPPARRSFCFVAEVSIHVRTKLQPLARRSPGRNRSRHGGQCSRRAAAPADRAGRTQGQERRAGRSEERRVGKEGRSRW